MHTRNLEQLKSAASTLTEEEKVALVEYLLENLPLNKRQVILNGGNFIRANGLSVVLLRNRTLRKIPLCNNH